MEDLMSPVMYQDTPSSFGMQPMPYMHGGIYGGMYPAYGTSGLRPALSEDKFQKIQKVKEDDKKTARKAAIGFGIGAAALITLGTIFKVPKLFNNLAPRLKSIWQKSTSGLKSLFGKAGTGMKNCWNAITNTASKGWQKLKNLF